MKTKRRTGLGVVSVLVLLALFFGAGYYMGKYYDVNMEISDYGGDVKLPGEVEKRVVTKEEITSQLSEIKELSTYSGEYTVTKSVDFTRYLMESVPIPGTTNKIKLECTGIVKVGYDIDAIEVRVNSNGDGRPQGGTIYISLPLPKVNDNYLIWDKVQCEEANSIFNPIDFDQYKSLISDIEEEGLTLVEEQGIYRAAEDNIKMLIENFLSQFQGYEIEYM